LSDTLDRFPIHVESKTRTSLEELKRWKLDIDSTTRLTAAASARLLPENDDIMVVEEQEEAKGQQLQMVQKQKSEQEQENKKKTKNTKISNKKKDQIRRSVRQRDAKNLTNNLKTDQTHEEEDLKLVDKGTKKKLK